MWCARTHLMMFCRQNYAPWEKKRRNLHAKKSVSMLHVKLRILHPGNSGYKSTSVPLRFKLSFFLHATCKMPRLNEEIRNRAIGRLERRESHRSVSRHFNVSHSTISSLWQRYRLYNSARDRPRSGRLSVTTPAQDHYIRIFHLRYRTVSATHTADNVLGLCRVSAEKIRNRLREQRWNPHSPPTLKGKYFSKAARDHTQHVLIWTIAQTPMWLFSHGHQNAQISIQLSICGICWTDVYDGVSSNHVHDSRWCMHCSMSGEGFLNIRFAASFSLCHGDAEQCSMLEGVTLGTDFDYYYHGRRRSMRQSITPVSSEFTC